MTDKKNARQVKRTPKQEKALERAAEARDLAVAASREKAEAARLAQVVNLHIAGFSLAEIGASIGASADEVDRMITRDSQRYIRNQPQLRVFVRNYVSGKYTQLLDAVWDRATDKGHAQNFEAIDRAERILTKMARLHGAEAPTQAEVKVDAAPEAVEKMVAALSAAAGVGYDTSIFDAVSDVVDAEIVHDAADLADAGKAFPETDMDEGEEQL